MPNKLKKAIGAVKDQTSISIAKVVNTNSASLEVAVLKATTHDQYPIDDRYVKQILGIISSNKLYAAISAHAIAKRIGKTKNWVVALKSLMLVLRIFQDGNPYFPKEVLLATNRGAKILNLSTFRDDSNSSPYDYTAFVRFFAFYLEERLDCFLTGKLQRRFTFKERESGHLRSGRVNQEPVQHMKPPLLLDRISYWQRLLDRAIATKPAGAAKTNRLVLVSFYSVVLESFDLYRDISDGLGILLDSFFQLQYQSCVNVFQYCVQATKQFEELSSFYDYCKSLGIGRTSEYPSVQNISEELMDTLQEFLKDQASFPSPGKSPSSNSPRLLLFPAPPAKDPSETTEGEPKAGSKCTSSEDMISQTESVGTISPSFSVGHFSEMSEKQRHEQEDMYNVTETGSNHSLPIDQGTNVTTDFISFDDWPMVVTTQTQQNSAILDSTNGEKGCWDVALVEAPAQLQASQNVANDDHSFFDNWVQQDHKQEQGSQNGENGSSFFNNWLHEDQRNEQASAKCHSYINEWLQDNQKHEQASHVVGNGHSCFDDWLQEDKNLEHASQIVATGHSYFEEWPQEDKKEPEEQQQNSASNWNNGGKKGWELVFVEAATQPAQASEHLANGIEPSMENYLFDERPIEPQRQYNPFLEDETDMSASIATTTNDIAAFPDEFSMAPTFHANQSPNEMATPTFQAMPTSIPQNPNGTTAAFQDDEYDPFAPWATMKANNNVSSDGSVDQQNVLLQQELWLQNQNKIMARHIV
ncbi:clathrin coat assembly protein AP180-like [Durio zibethinus]|uniref:Clathrin coat assembly protein AP180-like n=1 Tax=Durio zibethinus TaxID=66656 RepID=A0A6P6A560_DURZI|nr:clathrin coat assembly protein AP180-like [Durio zibethinus]